MVGLDQFGRGYTAEKPNSTSPAGVLRHGLPGDPVAVREHLHRLTLPRARKVSMSASEEDRVAEQG